MIVGILSRSFSGTMQCLTVIVAERSLNGPRVAHHRITRICGSRNVGTYTDAYNEIVALRRLASYP